MRPVVDRLLAASGGAVSRCELLTVLTRNQLDDELARGHLVTVFPRSYTRPWDVDEPEMRDRAAVASVGDAAISHTSALRRWRLPVPDRAEIHVTTAERRHPRGRPGALVVHRARLRPATLPLGGVPTTRAECAIVDSWPLLTGSDQRAPAIVAIRSHLVPIARLEAAATMATRRAGRADLLALIGKLRDGCRSELELWGYDHVSTIAGLRHASRQRRVRAAGRTYYLDMAFDEERVAVELDGRAYHSSREHWERDTRRDLALATIGWQTIRLSHRRLTSDVEGCRRDVLAVLASRRRWPRSG